MTAASEPEDHLVHEAVGPDFHPLETAGAMAIGVNGLLVLGVLPILLGDMAVEGRLSAAGIGQAATLELLAMGVVTALAGMLLKPKRLKLLGVILALALLFLTREIVRASEGQPPVASSPSRSSPS